MRTFDKKNPTIQNFYFFLDDTDKQEVENIIKSLNIKKTVGIDYIRPSDIKNNFDALTSVITTIVNASFHDAVVQNALKTSKEAIVGRARL